LSLREQIIAEMRRREDEQKSKWEKLDIFHRPKHAQYCTWWFKFKLPFTTAEIRRELERMERDKLVIADREQSKNTKWLLVSE